MKLFDVFLKLTLILDSKAFLACLTAVKEELKCFLLLVFKDFTKLVDCWSGEAISPRSISARFFSGVRGVAKFLTTLAYIFAEAFLRRVVLIADVTLYRILGNLLGLGVRGTISEGLIGEPGGVVGAGGSPFIEGTDWLDAGGAHVSAKTASCRRSLLCSRSFSHVRLFFCADWRARDSARNLLVTTWNHKVKVKTLN